MAVQACSFPPNISKATVKAMLNTPQSFGVDDPQSESGTLKLLNELDDSQWEIVSFNPQTREVCIDIVNNAGLTIHLSVTLPMP